MKTFKHSGRMGDTFYSLYWCLHVTQGEPFDLILRTGVSAWDPSNRPHLMERSDADFMLPLLLAQPYIRSVHIVGVGDPLPADCVDLDAFRENFYAVCRREIRLWYYPQSVNHSDEFFAPILSAPDPPEPCGKFAICFTPRYKECFDVGILDPFRDELVFIGLKSEHEAFLQTAFPCRIPSGR